MQQALACSRGLCSSARSARRGGALAGNLECVLWDQYARSYDNLAKHFRPYRDLVSEVCDHLDDPGQRSLRILDAGCGTGNYSWELARRGHRVVGVDASLAMLTRAEAKRIGVSEYPTFVQHDLNLPLPFADHSFDAAIMTMVLYALPEPRVLLHELRRVVVDNGLLAVVTMRKPADIWGSLAEVYRKDGLPAAARTVRWLAGVGVWNLLINARHSIGNYRLLEPDELGALLDASGWQTRMTAVTYTCRTASLAVASATEDSA